MGQENLGLDAVDGLDFTKITATGGLVEIHLDVESTSLRGLGFAFGAIVRQGNQVIHKCARLSEEGAAGASEWVKDNVLPHLGDLPKVAMQDELYAAFWTLYATVKSAVIETQGCKPWELAGRFAIVGDNMWPVEAGFVMAAHDWAMKNAGASEFDGPYMPIDVTSVLWGLGYNPDLPRSEAAEALGVTGAKHNPVVDALQSMAVLDAARRHHPLLEPYKV